MTTLDPWQILYVVRMNRQTLTLSVTKYHLNDRLNKSQWGKGVHVCGYG